MATVLLIEDEDVVRQVIAEVLEAAGYKVMALSDAEPALNAVNYDSIDLIITDLAMPTRGEEAIPTLRSSGVTVPIIVLSGILKDGDDLSLKSIGADRVLAKPLDIKLLLNTIHELQSIR